jgi:pimeloyl-ACP methyl ester carboxylesterase
MNISEFSIPAARGPFTALRSGNPNGEKLLCLHGWLDNAASFLPLMPHLQQFDVVALDLAGHGGSAHRHPSYDYAFVDWLHDVLDVLDSLGWQRAHLLGHSMGGAIASVLASAAPERVLKLCLIEALGPVAGVAHEAGLRLRQAVATKRSVRAERQAKVIADIETAIDAARLIVQRNLREVEGGYIWRSDARLRLPTHVRTDEQFIRSWLSMIEAPTFCIAAENHPQYFSRELQDARMTVMKNAKLIRFDGSHHLHMEIAGQVAPAITEFLAA